jgi:hypothetical protein
MSKQRVNVKLLPDKSGRVMIHWFMWDEAGPIELTQAPVMTANGPMVVGGNVVTGETKGRIACNPALKDLIPRAVGGIGQLCVHSDDPRAVTCPDCKKVPEFAALIQEYSETLAT